MVVTLFFWSIIIIVPVHISFQSSWRMTWSNCYHHSNTHKSLGGMKVLAVPRPFRTSCWSTLRFMPQISEIHKFRVSMHFSKKKGARITCIKQLFHNIKRWQDIMHVFHAIAVGPRPDILSRHLRETEMLQLLLRLEKNLGVPSSPLAAEILKTLRKA